jgi:hypothetical protein
MTRAIRAIQFGLVALTLVLFGSVASAEPKQKIAVLGVEAVVGANGQIDPADTQFAKELTKELRSRANISKSYILVKDQRELVDEKLMNNCGNEAPQCMAPIGASMGADVLLFGKVANAKDRGYKVNLTLVDVRKRQGIGSDTATITAGEKTNPGLGNWVRDHYKKVTNESSDGQLIITAIGANGGRVLVNGETKESLKSGQATVSLSEGRYRVGVDADGFKLWEQEGVMISPDRPTELKPDLVRTKPIDTTLPNNTDTTTTTTGTEDLTSREGTISGKKSKTVWKVAAAVGIGGAVVGGAFMAYSFKQMSDFDSYKVDGAMWEPDPAKTKISDSDCGKGKFINGNASNVNSSFESACGAKDRMNWLVPTTIGFAAIGAGALIYVMVSKDDDTEQRPAGVGRRVKKTKNLIVTPVVSPDNTGATLRFDW